MIIYLEDNLNNQRLLQRMLSKRGLEVVCYDDPDKAFEAILADKPELIFVDVHIKARQTGLDVVRRVRQEGITTPMIVVTAFAMMADRQRALEAGCNDYLRKPFEMKDLFPLVDRYLGQTEAPKPENPSQKDNEDA
jgi:CheY-like chemotaxis protein